MGNSGLYGAKIPQTFTSAGLIEEPLMEGQHLAQAEITHLSEAAIELSMLCENKARGVVKILSRGGDEIAERGCGQVRDGYL